MNLGKSLHTLQPSLQRVLIKAQPLSSLPFIVDSGTSQPLYLKRLVSVGICPTLLDEFKLGSACTIAAYLNRRRCYEYRALQLISYAILESSTYLDIPVIWLGDSRYFGTSLFSHTTFKLSL